MMTAIEFRLQDLRDLDESNIFTQFEEMSTLIERTEAIIRQHPNAFVRSTCFQELEQLKAQFRCLLPSSLLELIGVAREVTQFASLDHVFDEPLADRYLVLRKKIEACMKRYRKSEHDDFVVYYCGLFFMLQKSWKERIRFN